MSGSGTVMGRSSPRTARRLAVTAVLVVGAALGGAGTAAAAPGGGALLASDPTDCTVQLYGHGARAYCSGGTGKYRAAVRCDKNGAKDYNRFGSWVTAGRWSFADCNSADKPFNQRIELQ
jgi:hypothetical protein